jgi:hypothetical protein
MLQSIVEPVVLTLEPDQHAGRFPMPGDQGLFGFSKTEEPR